MENACMTAGVFIVSNFRGSLQYLSLDPRNVPNKIMATNQNMHPARTFLAGCKSNGSEGSEGK